MPDLATFLKNVMLKLARGGPKWFHSRELLVVGLLNFCHFFQSDGPRYSSDAMTKCYDWTAVLGIEWNHPTQKLICSDVVPHASYHHGAEFLQWCVRNSI